MTIVFTTDLPNGAYAQVSNAGFTMGFTSFVPANATMIDAWAPCAKLCEGVAINTTTNIFMGPKMSMRIALVLTSAAYKGGDISLAMPLHMLGIPSGTVLTCKCTMTVDVVSTLNTMPEGGCVIA